MVVFVCLVLLAWLMLAGLTLTGARRRGQGTGMALVAGLAFPVTWVAWYVRDDLR